MSDYLRTSRIRLGVLFALEMEQRALERVLAESRSWSRKRDGEMGWTFGSLEVSAIVSGVGRERCAAAAERLVRRGVHRLVCAGFAAGLDPTLSVGDVVVARRVLLAHDNSGESIASDQGLLSVLPPMGSMNIHIQPCDIATSDHIVCASEEKNRLHQATGAGALDMESYGAAEVCRAGRVPFAVIRSISDAANEDIPQDVADFLSLEAALDRVVFILSKPGIWRTLLRLRGQADTAAENLGDVLGMMLLRMMG
ncbi:MAG: hypothetical protein ABFD54_18055 [Armatimonadota bacterium]|nr:hypothetical protein [bacterium]